MSPKETRPDFAEFTRWLAAQHKDATPADAELSAERYQQLSSAAIEARDEYLRTSDAGQSAPSTRKVPHREVLQLLAAADKSGSDRPPELTTARGFRVTLAYEDATASEQASICVLVRCPPELVQAVQGQMVYLWNGSQRFELGEFDADGKAIGTLPSGIEVSLSDFAQGNVMLEPPPDAEE